MGQTVKHYKYKNIAMALAIALLLVLSISSACSSRNESKGKEESSQAESSLVDDKLNLTSNYKYISVKNDETLSKGLLVLVNKNHPYKGTEPDNIDRVYNYLFDKDGNQIMQASGTGVKGNKTLLASFNSMINAFYKETGVSNIVINTIYTDASESSENDDNKSEESLEHVTGYALDLNTYDAENGSYPVFTATGKYSWIGENCWKYGFIQRYTEEKASITGVDAKTYHFRYVGQLNSEIMHKNNLCLEEYLDYLKEYSFENPLEYESENGNDYVLYYVAAGKEKSTNLPIPLDEKGTEYKYGYSGNNTDGYVVWVKLTENEALSSSSLDSTLSSTDSILSDSAASDASLSDSSALDSSSLNDDASTLLDSESVSR